MRQLEGNKEAARSAQVQLWKLMGLEECVPQCRDPLLVHLKEQALLERETLLAEVSPNPYPQPKPQP